MEAVVVPCKQIKTPKRSTVSRSRSSSRPEYNFAHSDVHGRLSFYPPPHLLSPSPSSFQHPQVHRLPPILQTPVHHLLLPSRTGDIPSSPPKPKPARKAAKSRNQSLAQKKSKSPEENKDSKLDLISPTTIASDDLLIGSTACLCPDSINLKVDLSRRVVLSPSPSSLSLVRKDYGSVSVEELNGFSSSVITLSPHPNSLPLPKFSIKPKRACNVEAGGIDTGATDNLRRLLRLQ